MLRAISSRPPAGLLEATHIPGLPPVLCRYSRPSTKNPTEIPEEPKKVQTIGSLSERQDLITPCPELSIRRQCELVNISRSGFYYEPCSESEENLKLMLELDKLHLKWSSFGSRRLTVMVNREGWAVNRKRVSDEIGYYATSLGAKEFNDDELIEIIRGHWDAIENGAHHRRDVSFGEDACGVSKRGAAQVLSALRNLVLGNYELEKDREHTNAPSARSGCRQMTFTRALKALKR